MTITASDIVRVARSFVGTPFHHLGRLKGHGVDCIGLVTCTARELGLSDHDLDYYPEQPPGNIICLEFDKAYNRISADLIGPGDVGIFWVSKRDKPVHACLFTEMGMVHTHQEEGKVVEHVFSPFWQVRLYCAYRFRGADIETKGVRGWQR